jgi:hypothetical protein
VDCAGLSHPLGPLPKKQGQLSQGRAQPTLAVLMKYASLSDMTGAGMTNHPILMAGQLAGEQYE